MKTLLYHSNCMDGFCAAWLFHNVYPDAEFIPVQYGQEPPDLTGKDVVIADFSYPYDVMLQIIEQTKSLVVLDHHKTAEAALAPLVTQYPYLKDDRVRILFDMKRSGAMLMWHYLHANDNPPWIVQYVQDRDLWKWELPNSKEVNAAIAAVEKTFDEWDILSGSLRGDLARQGKAILCYQQGVIDHHVKNATKIVIDTHEVPCVNATTLISEIGNELAKGQPFAAMYFIQGDEKVWSLRSAPDGLDVSEIAKKYGGGGHKHAAGFRTVVRNWPI